VLGWEDFLIMTLFGCMGGFLAGYLGVGGGIIFVPILDIFLSKIGLEGDVLVKAILANSLFAVIFSGSVSSFKQYRMGNFFLKQVVQTAIPGMFTALFMTYLIKSGTWYQKSEFNIVFASILAIIFVRMFFGKSHLHLDKKEEAKPLHYRITGFFSGFITALSGLGGGIFMTPIIGELLKQDIRKASSISNGVIPFFSIAIGIYNLMGTPPKMVSDLQVGFIIFPVVLPLILGIFVCAPIGVRLSQQSSQKLVRTVFATFVCLTLIKLLYEIFFKS